MVLFIAPSINVKGGISSVLKNYISSNLKDHYEIQIVASHVDGIKIRKFTKAVTGLLKTIYCLIRYSPKLVHIHSGNITSLKRKYYYFKIVRCFQCKILFQLHGGAIIDQFNSVSNKWQDRIDFMFSNADLVVCLSETWKIKILKKFPYTKIKILPNAINIPQDYLKERNTITQISFLGHIKKEKGIFDLLEVMKKLKYNGVDVILNIAGSGEVKCLIKTIKKMSIADRVKFLGWISESQRNELLKRTDIFVLPSYSEALPMSILEAMSFSVAIVSTKVGSIPELVTDNENGYLINPGDKDGLYQKLEHLILNRKLRKKFGRKSKKIIETKHNIKIIAKKIIEIYNSQS